MYFQVGTGQLPRLCLLEYLRHGGHLCIIGFITSALQKYLPIIAYNKKSPIKIAALQVRLQSVHSQITGINHEYLIPIKSWLHQPNHLIFQQQTLSWKKPLGCTTFFPCFTYFRITEITQVQRKLLH
ncbi:hypothetical protein BMF38_09235 [Comamonas kerstersii]|nr:hypothetical protein BMF38_09235 [Comamonas kerstersii]